MFIPLLKTILGKKFGADWLLDPIILHLIVTNRCNAQCQMCNIWQVRDKKDISPECLCKYRNSRFGRNLRILDITGGEPFLCDLPTIIKAIDNGSLGIIVISTNGLLPERIEQQILQIRALTKSSIVIEVSIDGLGATNDAIRGISGAYEASLETIRRVNSLQDKKIKTWWKFTILKENINQIMGCVRVAHQLGADFSCKPAARYGFLYNQEKDFSLTDAERSAVIQNLKALAAWTKKRMRSVRRQFWDRVFVSVNNLFLEKLIRYYQGSSDGKKNIDIECYSSFLSVLLNNDGLIYSCPTFMHAMGDISREPVEAAWRSAQAQRIRNFIRQGKCNCYSQCDQLPSIIIKDAWKIMLGAI